MVTPLKSISGAPDNNMRIEIARAKYLADEDFLHVAHIHSLISAN